MTLTRCPGDTDGDGNCAAHPSGCPPVDEGAFRPADPSIVDRAADVLERMRKRTAHLDRPMDACPHRPELPVAPARIRSLPVHRGYPVPWFVEYAGDETDFRVASLQRQRQAVAEHLCWICGTRLGKHLAFLVGPMCAINRISAEPPSHRECAEYSAAACPFLSRPHMTRREDGLPEDRFHAGDMIRRNPGVTLLWLAIRYDLVRSNGAYLFQMGRPQMVIAYREGRLALAHEVEDSVRTGLPLLHEAARPEGARAIKALHEATRTACLLLGIPPITYTPPPEPAPLELPLA